MNWLPNGTPFPNSPKRKGCNLNAKDAVSVHICDNEMFVPSEDYLDVVHKNLCLCKKLQAIQDLVKEQAEDEGLWFQAVYISETYLQNALRDLHTVIEKGAPE